MQVMTEEIGYVWQQAADEIQRRIEAGIYPPGSMLPNERELSTELGIAIGTLRRAKEELVARGLVVILPARGTFVARR